MASKGLPPGLIALLGLSPQVAAIKKKATKKQWAAIVDKAKKKGLTVEGLLSGNPASLAERDPASLAKQAQKTIAATYAPEFKSLDQADARTRALDEKRANDNRYYNDWLTNQTTQLKTDSQAADRALQDHAQGVQDQTAQQYKDLASTVPAQVAPAPGTVSDMSQSKALNFAPAGDRAVGLLADSRARLDDAIGSAGKTQAAYAANDFAVMAASEAKRVADTWSKLSDIGDERQKAQLSKASDTAKEVARLLDQEITKASSNRDFQAAIQKLGIQQGQLDLNKLKVTSQISQADRQFKLDMKKFLHQAHIDNLNIKIDQAKLDQGQQTIDLGWYKAKHPNTGGSGTKHDTKGSNQYAFDTAAGLIATQLTVGKKNKPADSNYVAGHRDQVIAILVSKGFDRRVAQAATQAFMDNGAGDPGDYKKALKRTRSRAHAPATTGR